MVSGQFGKGNMPYEVDGLGDLPHLSEMAEVALKILDNDADGFFLMVEGGKIDHAGHDNDLLRNVTETIEFARAVEVAMSWARDRTDTLIIVTADHECGGLKVEKNNGAGKLPTVSWSTNDHTAAKVPVYAWGANAKMAREIKDNTQIFSMATASDRLSASSAGSTIGATGSVLVVLILMVAISRYKRKTVESHKVA
jgi:alkaline phosphatase